MHENSRSTKLKSEGSLQTVHTRTDTTLVKSINQSYEFITALETPGRSSPAESLLDLSMWSEITPREEFPPIAKLPEKLYCPACRDYKRSYTKYVAPPVGFWRRLLCSECLSTSQGVLAAYCCKSCHFVLTQVKLKEPWLYSVPH